MLCKKECRTGNGKAKQYQYFRKGYEYSIRNSGTVILQWRFTL